MNKPKRQTNSTRTTLLAAIDATELYFVAHATRIDGEAQRLSYLAGYIGQQEPEISGALMRLLGLTTEAAA